MPDVFQVLKKDHDEVKAMLAQLEEGPRASNGATAEQLAFRKRAVDQVIIEESKHEAAEQQYFWPAVKQLGPDGPRVAEVGLEQEAEADPVLADLDKLQPDDEGFEERLAAFSRRRPRAHHVRGGACVAAAARLDQRGRGAGPWRPDHQGQEAGADPAAPARSVSARRGEERGAGGRGRGPAAGRRDRPGKPRRKEQGVAQERAVRAARQDGRAPATTSRGAVSFETARRRAQGMNAANSASGADGERRTARYGDQQVYRAPGGETHQQAGDGTGPAALTTAQGVPVSDDQNTLRAGERGPACSRTSTSARRSSTSTTSGSPSGSCTPAATARTATSRTTRRSRTSPGPTSSARPGLRTPAFVRFSTVAGNKGSGDLARDVRGFAVKFYTREGNWDLVGNNIPVFFIQDAIKFPDLIHAAKQEPDRGFPQAQTAHDNFWDFASLMPESTHMLMWIMSDRAIPRSFRFMEGFGVHTFRLVNEAGRSTYVKFHWKPKQGLQSVVWNEAVKINGADPDFHRRDLWDAITQRRLPGVGARPAAVRRRVRRPVRVRRARPHEAHPGGAGAGAPGRPAGPRPRGGQLLRRDRAGRVLHAERRAGHRLHERPAAAGAELLLPGHAAQAARQPELHAAPGQRAEVPVRALPAGRPHGHESTRSRGRTTSRTRGRAPRAARARTRARATAATRRRAAGPSGGCARRASPTTTARRASSTSARPTSSAGTSPRRSRSSSASASGRRSGPGWWPGCATWTRSSPRRVAEGLGLRELPAPAEPARPPRHDLPASPALSILAATAGPGPASPGASSACW